MNQSTSSFTPTVRIETQTLRRCNVMLTDTELPVNMTKIYCETGFSLYKKPVSFYEGQNMDAERPLFNLHLAEAQSQCILGNELVSNIMCIECVDLNIYCISLYQKCRPFCLCTCTYPLIKVLLRYGLFFFSPLFLSSSAHFLFSSAAKAMPQQIH